MSRKAFHVGIDLDIHAVSCPGVWLCPRGDAMLKISMMGASAHTKRVEPTFPMLYHESFHFRKTFTGVTSLAGLQAELAKKVVDIRLVQWQVHGCRCVLLAVFRSPLTDLLYPQPAARRLLAGVDIDLLMETTPCFPGIIAPKIEISTKVVIEEMVNYSVRGEECVTISHKTLTSKKKMIRGKNKSVVKSRIRQKPVCHTRPCVKCYYCKERVERGRERCECLSSPPSPTHYIPYCNKCGDVVEEKEVKHGKIIMKESANKDEKWEATCPCVDAPPHQSVCDCSLCLKYQQLFKNPTFLPKSSDYNKVNRSPSPKNKDKKCPCLDTHSGGEALRMTGGTSKPKYECPCVSNWDRTGQDNEEVSRDKSSGLVQKKRTDNNEYRDLLKRDLNAHYRKLYERVSRRSNNHCES